MKNHCLLSAREIVAAIAKKKLTSVEVVEACLARIHDRGLDVGAWTYLNAEQALAEAKLRDQQTSVGPLHGVPIGIKDMIDTVDMPTEYGSSLYKSHSPQREAACVSLIRKAGGVILGKTVTTEFALYQPGKTTNPHNIAHTPGGSSSGSAAAVADFQVPVALGTQTSGSIIRPAAFCGVVGYKPTFNSFSVDGIKPLAASLDTLGYITRTVDDLKLMHEVFLGPVHFPVLGLSKPRIAVCRTPFWSESDECTQRLFEQVTEMLKRAGFNVEEVSFPSLFADLKTVHEKLMAYEVARNYVSEYKTSVQSQLGSKTREVVEYGWSLSTEEYYRLRAVTKNARAVFSLLYGAFDAVMVPAAVGEATLASVTGNPVFSRIWSLLGTPAISLPAGVGQSGLPLGIQFVADIDQDKRLIATCEQIESLLLGRVPQISVN